MDFDAARTCLRNSELFSPLGDDERGALLMSARVVRFKQGETILRRGDRSTGEVHLLVVGRVEILTEGEDRVEAVRPAGTVLGEIATISPQQTRTRTVRAAADCELLAWDVAAWSPGLLAKVRPQFERIAFERLAGELA